jgi:hypothetical protein
MSDDTNPPSSAPAPGTGTTTATAASPGASRAMLIWVGVAVVLLSFVAAFLGARVAQTGGAPEAVATATPTSDAVDEAAYEEALEEILPAGSAVRAGTGAPEAGKGYEGDVYIDISNANVYLFQDGDWVLVGNIRESAAANLTGATGATGETGAEGATGATGETGAPGEPGTQLTLGLGAPENEKCTTDGDVYIDTEAMTFYECTGGQWALFGPTDGTAPAPTPTAEPEG